MSHARPAVFLDRDGLLIEHHDVLKDSNEVKLLPGVGEGLKALKDHNYLLIVVTNQPAMEEGIISKADLEVVHARLQELLIPYSVQINAFYTCPHRYQVEGQCACRKPGTALIEQAARDFPIDMTKSWMIGDRLRDIETGHRANLSTILVRTGTQTNGDDAFFPLTKPRYSAKDLRTAARKVSQELAL